MLKNKFGAGVIIKHNMKHFSGAANGEESCICDKENDLNELEPHPWSS